MPRLPETQRESEGSRYRIPSENSEDPVLGFGIFS